MLNTMVADDAGRYSSKPIRKWSKWRGHF